MATLPFSRAAHQTFDQPAPVLAAPRPAAGPARLSPLEWSVVALAERDSLATLREPGRLANALNALFGLSRPNPLANPGLEAVRRMAVLIWHHRWSVPKSEIRAFLAAGFSVDQYELVQASIAKARSTRTPGTQR